MENTYISAMSLSRVGFFCIVPVLCKIEEKTIYVLQNMVLSKNKHIHVGVPLLVECQLITLF